MALFTNFCPIKIDLSGNTVWPQTSGFQKIVKIEHFWHFVWTFGHSKCKVSRLARNVEWDFFYDFQTLCDLEKIDSEFPPAVKCSLIDNLSGKIPVLWPCPYCLRCGLSQETRWESLALLCHLAPIFKIPGFLNQFYQKWTREKL